jgi:hypothetical protein
MSYSSCVGASAGAGLGVCVPGCPPPVLRLLLVCLEPIGLVRLAGFVWTVFTATLGAGVVGEQLSDSGPGLGPGPGRVVCRVFPVIVWIPDAFALI